MVPKKVTLRALAEHTSDLVERAQLLWWSSTQGAADYTQLMQSHVYLAEILRRCPSCRCVVGRSGFCRSSLSSSLAAALP